MSDKLHIRTNELACCSGLGILKIFDFPRNVSTTRKAKRLTAEATTVNCSCKRL